MRIVVKSFCGHYSNFWSSRVVFYFTQPACRDPAQTVRKTSKTLWEFEGNSLAAVLVRAG